MRSPSLTSGILPYGRQTIDEGDVAAVTAALRGEMLTGGPLVERFESAIAERISAQHAVACCNGTAALHLAALALNLGPGTVAMVPSATFLATANAVRLAGGDVVFTDVDPESGLMTAATFEEALARAPGRAAAVLPVHLAGQCADMVAIEPIARRHDMAIVEDACHALGTVSIEADGEWFVGQCHHSDAAVFSFHPVKTITTGEGGCVTTNAKMLADRMRLFRNHGMIREPQDFQNVDMAFVDGVPNPWYYEMQELGLNYRITDLQCALGLSQLGKLDHFLERRNRCVALYDELLAPLAPVLKPLKREPWSRTGWHLYVVRIDFAALGTNRAAVMAELRSKNILTQVHYIPVHRQPYYRRLNPELSLPGADAFYDAILSLPLFPTMHDEDVHAVVDALAKIVGA